MSQTKTMADHGDAEKAQSPEPQPDLSHLHGQPIAFIGRLGGNQAFVVDRNDPRYTRELAKEPDAAPGMTLKQQFDMRPFLTMGLWKAAAIEGFGTSRAHI